jgi:hypothetical protein
MAPFLKRLSLGIIGAVFLISAGLVVSAPLFGNPSVVNATRWLILSGRYKSRVLAQPALAGELKHIASDGWGWGGQDTTVYLVFDPTDSLSAAASNHKPGKFNGIPCEVALVRRMERQWYTAQFYADEYWSRRTDYCGFGLPD